MSAAQRGPDVYGARGTSPVVPQAHDRRDDRVMDEQLKNTETLEQSALYVCSLLESASKFDSSAFETRLEAGRRLLALRPRVEAEGFGWNSWCEHNINRSRGEIAKAMRLARSADPEAAAEAERENNRRQKAEQRERDKQSLQNDVSVRDAETQQILTVAKEEKADAAAAAQRRQEALAAAFQADREALEAQRVRAAQEAVVAALSADTTAVEINLDRTGYFLWNRIPHVVEIIGSVLSVAEMHALHDIIASGNRLAFAAAISSWIAGNAPSADGTTPTVARPEPEPEADDPDFDQTAAAAIQGRNADRVAPQEGAQP